MPRDTEKVNDATVLLRKFLRNEQMPLDRMLHCVHAVRETINDTEAADRVILHEYALLRANLGKVMKLQSQFREAHKELEEAHSRLTAPPLRPATFLRFHDIAGVRAALVNYERSYRFVVTAETLDTNHVRTGDQVLLSDDLNVLVDKLSDTPLDCGETATFERCTSDGRLVLKRHDEEVVVYASARLDATELKAGDIVRMSETAWVAYEKIDRPADDQLFLEKTPRETFDDVGGLAGAIRDLRELILLHVENRKKAELYGVKPLGGLLLVGPPGTGKTMLARALANWMATLAPGKRSRFIHIKPGELGSMWYSKTEENIRNAFRMAREVAESEPGIPIVMFFDEIDSISGQRGTSPHHVDERVVNTLCTELDGLEERGNILVIGATNRLDAIDTAIRRAGRLGDKIINIPRPNRAAARSILSKHVRRSSPYATNGRSKAAARDQLIDAVISRLYAPNGDADIAVLRFRDGKQRTVTARDMISGAGLAKIAQEGARRACLRDIETGTPGIRLDDVLTAATDEIDTAACALTAANCRHYIDGLPQDVDVVSVEPVQRKAAQTHHYLRIA